MATPKVLLVDDEESVLSALTRLIMQEGTYDVTATSSPYEALHLVSKESFAIIISDHRMPVMEGACLLEKIKEVSPQTMRIMLTGYADINAAMDAINMGEVYRYLTKPWDNSELKKVLKEAITEFYSFAEQKNAAVKNKELQERYDKMMEKNIEQVHENQKLNQALEQSHIDSVGVIARSVQIYNPRLWHHLMGVTMLCRKMAKLINLSQKQFLQLEVAALLHDIGKLGISESILRKPISTLTTVEAELINSHPLQSFSIVNMIPLFQEAAYFVRHHHESYDGTGFPDGLKGDAIPSASRIIAVADAYDKSVKRLPNQPHVFSQEAFDLLETDTEKAFDPKAISLLKSALTLPESMLEDGKRPLDDNSQYWQTAMQDDARQWLEKLTVDSPLYGSEMPILEANQIMDFSDDLLLKPDDQQLVAKNQIAIQADSPNNMAVEALTSTVFPIPTVSHAVSQSQSSMLSQEVVSLDAMGMLESLETEEPAILAQDANSLLESASMDRISWNQEAVLPGKIEDDGPGLSQVELGPMQRRSAQSMLAHPILPLGGGKKRKTPQEIMISHTFLCAGMVLSRDLITKNGKKLLDKDSVILPDQVIKIKNFLKSDPPREGQLYIYKPQ